MQDILIIAGIVGVLVCLTAVALLSQFLGLWFQAFLAHAPVSLFDMVRMRFRNQNVRDIVLGLIAARKAGLDISLEQLASHDLAGGRVRAVIAALVRAHRGGIPLTWDTAARVDLAQGDVLQAVMVLEQGRQDGVRVRPDFETVAALGEATETCPLCGSRRSLGAGPEDHS